MQIYLCLLLLRCLHLGKRRSGEGMNFHGSTWSGPCIQRSLEKSLSKIEAHYPATTIRRCWPRWRRKRKRGRLICIRIFATCGSSITNTITSNEPTFFLHLPLLFLLLVVPIMSPPGYHLKYLRSIKLHAQQLDIYDHWWRWIRKEIMHHFFYMFELNFY